MDDEIMTIEDAAQLMKMGRSTIYRDIPILRAAGLKIHGTRPNGTIRFTKKSFLDATYRVRNQAGSK